MMTGVEQIPQLVREANFPETELSSMVFLNAFTYFLRMCIEAKVNIRLEYTTKETSRLLCVSPRTLARMRDDGSGPRFSKRRSNVIYKLHDLIEWSLKAETFQNTREANGRAA
jgi:hypothetical protein